MNSITWEEEKAKSHGSFNLSWKTAGALKFEFNSQNLKILSLRYEHPEPFQAQEDPVTNRQSFSVCCAAQLLGSRECGAGCLYRAQS